MRTVLKTMLILLATTLVFGIAKLTFASNDSSLVKINQIELHGNRELTDEKILELLGLRRGNTFSKNQLEKNSLKVLEAYQANGYYFARIDSFSLQYHSDNSKVNLKIYINEGEPLKVDQLEITGLNTEEAERWKDKFSTRNGKIFRKELLEEDIIESLKLLENSGYPFSQVKIQNLDYIPDKNGDYQVHITLHVDQGTLVRIQQVEIKGNELTRENVIFREARVKKGEIYDHRKVSRIKNRLMKLGYFEWVKEPQLFLTAQGQGGLLIELQEGNTNKFDGVIGYTPGTVTQRGYFTGLLNLSLGNLLGTGRKVEARWQKKSRESQELGFSYQEPWVLGFPVTLALGFQQLIQDTTYVQRHWDLQVQLPLSENLNAFSKIGRQEIRPDSLGSLLFSIPRSSTQSLTLGIQYDTRDDPINPRRGIYYQTALEFGRQKIQTTPQLVIEPDSKTKVNKKKLTMDFDLLLPLFQWQVFSLSLHGREVTSDEAVIPITDQFRFGGARTLRGYREEQFRGSRVALANLEYRYLLARRSRAFVFLDAGYFSREEKNKDLIQEYKLGYGFGIRLQTGLGIVGVDYGLGEGSGLLSGLIHVGLVNEF